MFRFLTTDVAAARVRPGPLGLARAAAVLGTVVLWTSCSGSSPQGPSGPAPPLAGGAISGRYRLELIPSASCGGRPIDFSVEMTETGDSPHPGVQLLGLEDPPGTLELELKYTDDTLEGGIGTTGDGALANDGRSVWVNAIASGQTTRTADGRGEVTAGTLRGYLEVDGVTDACTARDHAFVLRPE